MAGMQWARFETAPTVYAAILYEVNNASVMAAQLESLYRA